MTRGSLSQPATIPVTVPFLDLEPTAAGGIREEILTDIAELLGSHAYTNGPAVARFEEAFAAFCGTRECVGAASGLDALRLIFLAGGLRPGDEVLVPAMTFVATLEAVTQAGGRPVLVDVRDEDYCLNPAAVSAAMTSRTRALLPVHLYGHLADMRALRRLARTHDVALVEDACQAHGAEREGLTAGAAGTAAAFSFYPGKNLGAMGDAGALVTNDVELAEEARALREHGQRRKYEHDVEGYTARLDTIQALVLLRKLPHLDAWNDARRAAARYYHARLAGLGDLRLPPVAAGSEPVWHLYVVRTADPEGLAGFLREHGVGTGRHYPQPPHLSRAYAYLGHGPGDFPVTEALAAEGLSLPLFPGITEAQQEQVVERVAAYFDGG